jgi:hypothetical protein
MTSAPNLRPATGALLVVQRRQPLDHTAQEPIV